MLSMSYENSAGKVFISQAKEHASIEVRFTSYTNHQQTLEGFLEYKEQVDKVAHVIDKVVSSLKSDTFKSCIMRYSYAGLSKDRGIFTPYVCLERQYCLGVWSDCDCLAVIPYAAVIADATPIKRRLIKQDLFWSVINDSNGRKTKGLAGEQLNSTC